MRNKQHIALQFKPPYIHAAVTYAVAWSPDGAYLASASIDSTIGIIDAKSNTLQRKLHRHDGSVLSIDWSPDGQFIASGSTDKTVRIWKATDGALYKTLQLSEIINHVAWSPNGTLLAAASATSVHIWDSKSFSLLYTLQRHHRDVSTIAWSPNNRWLASCAADHTVCIWDVTKGAVWSTLSEHRDRVTSLAWSPDGYLLAAGAQDRIVRIWEVAEQRHIRILERHTATISALAFSFDGRLLASKQAGEPISEEFFASDSVHGQTAGRVVVWDRETWNRIEEYDDACLVYSRALAFHPYTYALAIPNDINGISVRHVNVTWEAQSLRPGQEGQQPKVEQRIITSSGDTDHEGERTIHYTNAKVVLVGDTGVGKSGLGLVLSNQPFKPTESTHSRHIWNFDIQEVELSRDQIETREILLWDLAGQPAYRLIHQLYLNEVAVVLVVFDERSETDPFAGIRYWSRALRQAQRAQGGKTFPLHKFLISARLDRAGIGVSRERIKALMREQGFHRYIPTSAKAGWNISLLAESIRSAVQWELLPRVTSTELFQRIKSFLINEKKAGKLLLNVNTLLELFQQSGDGPTEKIDLQAQFETCIALVESRGLIRRLNFGGFVLLQPERLDAYASALVIAARDEPDGLGSITEEQAHKCQFRMADDVRIKDKSTEYLLMIATIDDLLRHEIALRDTAEDGTYLIFPSQLTRERVDLPDPEGKAAIIEFEGPVLNIYATLSVRLSHSGIFTTQEMWKNAITFNTRAGGVCGVSLREIEEGRGELTLFFDKQASEETKFQFEEYIVTHLQRRAVVESVVKRRVFSCDACGTALTDTQVNRRRERGYDWINCGVCEMPISLLVGEERLKASRKSVVAEIDRSADAWREIETVASIVQGKLAIGEADAHNLQLIVTKRRRLNELEQQQAFYGMDTPPHILMEISDLHQDIKELALQVRINTRPKISEAKQQQLLKLINMQYRLGNRTPLAIRQAIENLMSEIERVEEAKSNPRSIDSES